jgi:hypothetical protein
LLSGEAMKILEDGHRQTMKDKECMIVLDELMLKIINVKEHNATKLLKNYF